MMEVWKEFKTFVIVRGLIESSYITGNTWDYKVITRSSDNKPIAIADISWRKDVGEYCFFPYPETFWTGGVLKQLAGAVRRINKIGQKGKKR